MIPAKSARPMKIWSSGTTIPPATSATRSAAFRPTTLLRIFLAIAGASSFDVPATSKSSAEVGTKRRKKRARTNPTTPTARAACRSIFGVSLSNRSLTKDLADENTATRASIGTRIFSWSGRFRAIGASSAAAKLAMTRMAKRTP